ncbi:Ldh family oxidoreductase [Coralliovum pocilloporae]|uniref:Ldh family oxidoreductase n=1 Tax=Coralliovum pocilloporae TaxID=3066369 RepID=UPI003306C85E
MPHKMSLEEAHQLATTILQKYGCDDENAKAVADTVIAAERDHAHSHGLFRIPGYVNVLKSGLVDGKARPTVRKLSPGVVQVNGHNCFAPLAQTAGKDALVEAARANGIAALALVGVHHFSALWRETEIIAEEGLACFAFTAYTPAVAPAGGNKPFFGTNPMSFAWPRSGQPPMVFDQASAAMARGDVQIAARDGKTVPLGTGITADGQPTTDPNEVLKGSMLTFGGYKGSAIALMIELLVGPLIGEAASFEAGARHNGDAGPPQGGELMLALDPARFGDPDGWADHAEAVFAELLSQDGVRLPGSRRQSYRAVTPTEGIEVADPLMDSLNALLNG